jgi:hypothetical protein
MGAKFPGNNARKPEGVATLCVMQQSNINMIMSKADEQEKPPVQENQKGIKYVLQEEESQKYEELLKSRALEQLRRIRRRTFPRLF